MSNRVTLSVKDWSELFSGVSRDNDAIFWVTHINNKTGRYEQLYLNNAYERLTGRRGQELFDNQAIFDSYIISDNKDELVASWLKRHYSNKSTDNVSVYCLKKDNGDKLWLRDAFYTIYDQHNQPLFGAGIALDITAEMDTYSDKEDKHYKRFQRDILTDHADLLKDKLNLHLKSYCQNPIESPTINITGREQQCAIYLLEGKSSKEIAKLLQISPRTVEVYINRLKARFGSKNKFHLVKHLVENRVI